MSRVLIVDDDSSFSRMVVRLVARHADISIDTASRYDEAQRRLQADVFDLVILDLGLPDGHGLQLLAGLRARGSTVPVVVVTGNGDAALVAQALGAGADDFVFKSTLMPAEFEARVLAALRRGHAARTVCTWEHLAIDLVAGRATIHGESIALTPTQVRLLTGLAIRAPAAVRWEDLALIGWVASSPSRGSFDNQMLALRRRLLTYGIDVTNDGEGGYALVRSARERAGCSPTGSTQQ